MKKESIFKFECKKLWKNLKKTDKLGVRYCEECNLEVFLIEDTDLNTGECVSIMSSEQKRAFRVGKLLPKTDDK